MVIAAALGTLNNLCASEDLATHFIQNDGLNYLLTYLQNPHDDGEENVCIYYMEMCLRFGI